MKEIILYEVLIPALKRLNKVDYDNIRFGVSERNICARLAHHLENIMKEYDERRGGWTFYGYFVDVEYNRMGNGNPKYYENSEHRQKNMVSDQLIHRRGGSRNLLAMEMKRKENSHKAKEDRGRLSSMVSAPKDETEANQYVKDTQLGVFIVISKYEVKMELYEAVNGKGCKTKEITLVYENGSLGSAFFSDSLPGMDV